MKYLWVWLRLGYVYGNVKYMFGCVSYLTAHTCVVDGSELEVPQEKFAWCSHATSQLEGVAGCDVTVNRKALLEIVFISVKHQPTKNVATKLLCSFQTSMNEFIILWMTAVPAVPFETPSY